MLLYVPRKLRDYDGKVLRPVRANVGVEAMYRKKLTEIIRQMHDSVTYWITSAYQAHRPRMAMDATPANELRDAMAKLSRLWLYNFDKLADRLAEFFATDVASRSDTQLAKALREAGFSVNFVITPAMRDIIQATIHENVSLIKSIPQQYLNGVEGHVMRSVQAGRDLGTLSKALTKTYGVTKRRAALIARDQNNKATAALNRARQTELGITEAVWVHSSAGKHPRPTHVKMNGKRYDISEGMYDSAEGRYVMPGELINCRCHSRSVIPGLG
jgi:SPP1 gp7 family putative phage head morphogenesis protein